MGVFIRSYNLPPKYTWCDWMNLYDISLTDEGYTYLCELEELKRNYEYLHENIFVINRLGHNIYKDYLSVADIIIETIHRYEELSKAENKLEFAVLHNITEINECLTRKTYDVVNKIATVYDFLDHKIEIEYKDLKLLLSSLSSIAVKNKFY